MDFVRLFVIVLVIIAIILLLNKAFKNKNKLSDFNDGNVELILPPTKLDSSTSTNYSYSIWFYIEDWNYKYGQEKVLLQRLNDNNKPCPKISFDPFQNDLTVSVETYPDSTTSANGTTSQTFNCTVKNVPVQSWVNTLVSINGRTLDVYLDGKLVKTCVMPGVAKIAGSAPVVITPSGGFSGFTSNVNYWATSSNPQDAWNIYRKGSGVSNVFNRYNIKLSVLQNNKETAAYKTPF